MGTDIAELAVDDGRVRVVPEDVEQAFVADPGRVVDDLVKGVIETDNISMTAAWLMKTFSVPGRLVWSDYKKNRLEIAPWVLEEIADELGQPAYIVEEYPTADRLEVERIPLKRR